MISKQFQSDLIPNLLYHLHLCKIADFLRNLNRTSNPLSKPILPYVVNNKVFMYKTISSHRKPSSFSFTIKPYFNSLKTTMKSVHELFTRQPYKLKICGMTEKHLQKGVLLVKSPKFCQFDYENSIFGKNTRKLL